MLYGCDATAFGCCPDGVTAANGFNGEGCGKDKIDTSCENSLYGCCSDGKTAAKGKG